MKAEILTTHLTLYKTRGLGRLDTISYLMSGSRVHPRFFVHI